MSKLIYNPTNEACAIWWGHTPVYVHPGKGILVEDVIADVVTGHNDYKHLLIFTQEQVNAQFKDEGGVFVLLEGQEQKVVRREELQSLDPETASIDVLRAYVTENNLKINADISESDLRVLVDEHMMG